LGTWCLDGGHFVVSANNNTGLARCQARFFGSTDFLLRTGPECYR
jgi:hypothetical protein